MSRRRRIWMGASLLVLAGVLFLLHRQFGPGPAPLQGPSGPRTLHFPEDRYIGSVWIRNWGSQNKWQPVGEARGDVAIPAGKEAKIQIHWTQIELAPTIWEKIGLALGRRVKVSARQSPALDALCALAPDDLQAVALTYSGGALPDRSYGGLKFDSAKYPYPASVFGKTRPLDLRPLTRFRTLRELELSWVLVSDKSLTYLKNLTSLRSLDLDITQIGDAGLKHIAVLTSLESLSLAYTKVSDAGLVHLKKLGSLRELNLTGTTVSARGRAELEKALPNCHISR